ncbi:MAG: phage integrase SAM-like domain-containing protein [Thermodesulfobacteriota bacterium]
MGLFKRGSVWWMDFVYKGTRIRRSVETKDRKLAQRIYDKVKGEIAEGKWFERLLGQDKTFKELMEKYMLEHSPKKSPKQHIRYKSSLGHLSPYFEGFALTEITPKMINEYKVKRYGEKAAPGTINRELNLMRHAFSMAVKEW